MGPKCFYNLSILEIHFGTGLDNIDEFLKLAYQMFPRLLSLRIFHHPNKMPDIFQSGDTANLVIFPDLEYFHQKYQIEEASPSELLEIWTHDFENLARSYLEDGITGLPNLKIEIFTY